MDLEALKARLAAGRQVKETVDAIEFSIVLPTPHAMRAKFDENVSPGYRVRQAKVSREILDDAIVGWQGMTERHFLPDGSTAIAVPFSAEARAMFLDEREDLADVLAIRVYARMAERKEQLQAAEKNS